MTALDPHRTLGLSPDASQAEIRRAYRHLAKLYHPDSAGERALPRFLAIQAAYEALVDDPTRPRASGRTGATDRPAGPPPPAWQADASRARATREAYRARNRRGSAGPSAYTSAPGGNGSGAGGGRGTGRGAGTDAGAGGGSATGAPGGGRSGRSTRRPKATIGSTSYDGADKEPFDPAWEGATWYGAGSGTYWTLNPKEYADPRKHGPEYLARSRRATGGDRSSRAETTAGRTAQASDAAPPVTDDPVPPPDAEQPSQDPAAGAPGSTNDALGWTAPKSRPTPAEDSVDPGPVAEPRRSGSWSDRLGEGSWGSFGSASGPAPAAASRLVSLRGLATSPIGRIALALLGWMPLGVVLAALTDGLPACGVGSGTLCADPLRAGIWPIHLLLIVVLAAVPRLAGIAASGAIAFLAVGLIGTPVLLVFGGPQTPTANATILAIIVFVGWLVGIGFALTGRVELPPWRGPRVR